MTVTMEQPGVFDRNTRALSLLRIAVGVLFLIFAEYKVFGTQFTFGGGFEGWIREARGVKRSVIVVPAGDRGTGDDRAEHQGA